MTRPRSAFSLLLLLLLAAPARGEEELGPEYVARTPPLAPEEERARFHLPPGFVVELVAAEPDIRKPMNLAFDDRGRLWATESVEYPFPVAEGSAGRDCVKVLEDTDGDGRADRVTRFAEGLNIPIGLLPLSDGAIVYSIPRLYRFRDVDGDGRADQRLDLYGTFGHRDTHGMINALRLNLDGWVYACHGYSNSSEIRGTDGQPLRMSSGNTFRMRADGSHAEQFTWGQVNPFGLCFDPAGSLYSADCHSLPAYQLLRGGYYPSFGKPHDGLGYAPALMSHDHGSTAISGIVYYAADQFPAAYRDTIFIGNVVTNRINHDRLELSGSSPKAVLQPDFLVSDDPWFRPVDLQLGPDGALYVADFYNRIIGHYEVPLTHPGRDRERGRIWRIYYRGREGAPRPRSPLADFARAGVSELVEALGHPNLAVRTRATNQLAARGGREPIEAARAALRSSAGAWTRAHSLWVLERLGGLEAEALEKAARDGDPLVRIHAQRVLAGRRPLTRAERRLALAALDDADPSVARAAAEALAGSPHPANLRPLLDLLRRVPREDTHLLHVARMALRDQLHLPETWTEVEKDGVDRDLIAGVASGVHSAEAASFLLRYLKPRPGEDSSLAERVQYLARYLPEAELGSLHELVRSRDPGRRRRQAVLLGALQRGTEERGGKLDAGMAAWASEVVGELLSSDDSGEVKSGIEAARGMKLRGLEGRLAAVALGKSSSEENRRLSLEALVAADPGRQVSLLGDLLADGSEPFALRERAALLLGDLRSPEAIRVLARELALSPERLAARIAAALSRSREGAETLLEEIGRRKAPARLLKTREVEARLSRSEAAGVRERFQALTAGLPPLDERLEKLIADRKAGFPRAGGEPARGALVFEKTCAPCHKLGERGKKIGPELAGIGLRGVDRLLEDLLDPSRNVDQAFSTTVVIQKDGLLRTGLLLSDETEVLVLADGEGREVRVPKSEIKSREVSPLSPMPSNIAETLPEADLYHLLAFLLAQREKKETAGGR